MLGRVSAIDGASARGKGGRIVLVEREDSNVVAIICGLIAMHDISDAGSVMFLSGLFSSGEL